MILDFTPTALILAILASLTLSTFLIGLAVDSRRKTVRYSRMMVGLAYVAIGLRLAARSPVAQGLWGGLFLADLLYVAFAVCIWLGTRNFVQETRFRRALGLVPAAIALWVAAAHALAVPAPWRGVPDHLAGGALFIWSGFHIWSLRRVRPFWEVPLLAGLLWAQGLSTLSQPFSGSTWWGPVGLFILVQLGIVFGLAFIIGTLREDGRQLAQEIARERQAEECLRASEARFRWAMEATSDGLWDWDVATGQVYYSPAYSRMLGYGPEEWSHRVESWEDLLHPDDRERVLAANHATIRGEVRSFEVEYRIRTKAGTWKWILGRGRAVERNAEGRALRMLGTHVDVDLRKVQELELRRVNRLYDLLSQLGQCLVRVGNRQELLDEFCRIAVQTGDYPLVWVGWADPAEGKVAPVARAGVECDAIEAVQVRLDSGRESRGLSGTCIREGRTVVSQDLRLDPGFAPWLGLAEACRVRSSAAFPIRLKGRVAGAFQVYGREPDSFSDQEVKLLCQAADHISFGLERFEMESERASLQEQVQQTRKMESLGTLAGGIAHDMNNVLGAILGLASANLEVHPEGSAAHRTFDTIVKAATRGGDTVRSLLRFARRTPVAEQDLDLNELVGDVVRILERTTLARIRFETDLAGDLQPIRGDASSLTNALVNLCVNAVDAIPEKGVLALRTRNLGQGQVEVTVADTGCGMPAEVLRRALEPFYTTKPQGKGTGLGLPLVYSTVSAHRGRIEIRSEPDRGTTVTLRFPAALPSPSGLAGLRGRDTAGHTALRILVVDDDDLVRNSLGFLLETLGHACDLAECGEDALARLERGLRPDVVILDLNMPGLGGVGTLPKLRRLNPRVPVLVATGKADQAALDLAASDECAQILEKPFTIETLRSCLDRAIALATVAG